MLETYHYFLRAGGGRGGGGEIFGGLKIFFSCLLVVHDFFGG